MSKTFDASLRTLIDECPDDWRRRAGRVGVPPGPASPVESDISRTGMADRAFLIGGPSPEVGIWNSSRHPGSASRATCSATTLSCTTTRSYPSTPH